MVNRLLVWLRRAFGRGPRYLQKRPNGIFDVSSIDAVAVLSTASFPDPDLAALTFDVTDRAAIEALFREVDFRWNVDGRGVSGNVDAYVFVKRGGSVSKYLIFGGYDYLLPDNAWTEMHEISPSGRTLFQRHTRT